MTKKINLFFITLVLGATLSQALFAQVNTEGLRRTDKKDGIHQSISLSTSVFGGNTDYFSISGAYRIDHIKGNQNMFFVIDATNSEKAGKNVQDSGFMHGRIIRPFKANKIEYFGQREWDAFNDLKYRNLVGTGLRFEWDLEDDQLLAIGVGILVETESFSGAGGTDEQIRSTNYISYLKKFGNWTYRNISYLQPRLDFADLRGITDHEFHFKVNKNFGITLNLKGQYDSDPPGNVEEFNYKITQSLKWVF